MQVSVISLRSAPACGALRPNRPARAGVSFTDMETSPSRAIVSFRYVCAISATPRRLLLFSIILK